MRISLVLSTVICLTASPSFALSEWRAQVQGSVGTGTGTQFNFDGGLNDPFASQTLSSLTGSGVSKSTASLSATGYIPTLQARANNNGTHAQAVAWGVQGYTNNTGATLSTSLVLNFTANVSGSNDVEARIYMFKDENFEFASDPGTILFETSSELWDDPTPFPANDLGPTGFDIQKKNFSGMVDETRTYAFNLMDGDSFYIWARLVATADNNGVADAFSTLTASFTDETGLAPAAVPEPSVAWLLAAGLLAAGRRARRRA